MVEAEAIAGGNGNVCLCILFNHPFPANIPLLRSIYAGRFPHVRFLIPFEQSPDPDVLTVYRGSFAHSSFAIEHLATLQATGASHFIFIHDDVLLSPYLNAGNILEKLRLGGPKDGFLGVITPTDPELGRWGFQIGSVWRLLHPTNRASGSGVESLAKVLNYLPSLDEATRKAAQYGIPAATSFRYDERVPDDSPVYQYFGPGRSENAEFLRLFVDQLTMQSTTPPTIPYPIACAGPLTDFYVVPADALADFARYTAILNTAGLFVEMSVPTAMMLACDTVVTMEDAGVNLSFELRLITPRAALAQLYNEPNNISIHPVKLSVIGDDTSYARSFDPAKAIGKSIIEGDYVAAVTAVCPDFDASAYFARYADLTGPTSEAYKHFYIHGLAEGRNGGPAPTVGNEGALPNA